ncbi:MAG: galactose ABC transporter substrate-binding protein [Lachnospiraceae bacterium]|nr:galactose ABC transporter substrate-binding protein [Lachnospiraceae bacterium]
MKKKVLSVLLSAAMAVSLTACGGAAQTAQQAAGDAAGAAADAASAAADTAADAAADAADAAADTAADAANTAADAAGNAADAAADAVADATGAANADLADKKVGVCIYQFSDNFMTLFRNELSSYLVSKGFSEANITIQDGANDQATQTNQIDTFITDGVDVLIINPVNSSSAATITDKVTAANIPLVYINREPNADEEKRWEDNSWNVCYVGCDARQSGTMQGEIISDLGIDAIDLNKNGKVDYVMIEGDPENVDAQYRTEFSVKALTDAGLEVNCLTDQVGNWDQSQGQTLVANALAQYGNDVEVVFCNNDAMALGALQAIQAAGRTVGTDIFLVGVDALTEACEDVLAGTMTGTVFNDHIAQSHSAADAAINYLTGGTNEHYIGCDYKKVTKDNAQEILDSLK